MLKPLAGALGLLCLVASDRAAALDNLFYSDLRLAGQATNARGDSSGFTNYGSRIGLRGFQELAPLGERTGMVYQAELGFERHEPEPHGTRLLLAGISGPYGQLSYGKQWSAFYEAIGRYMDPGLDQSGFAYEGSERLSDSLQYSVLYRETYLQVDAIRNDTGRNRFGRLQIGVDHQGPVWRYGFAVDLAEGGAQPLSATPRTGPEDPKQCNLRGVDCFGGSVGWRLDDLSVNASIDHLRSSADHSTGGAIALSWKPNVLEYYGELSAFAGPKDNRLALAGGLHFDWDPYVSSFTEFSLVSRDTSRTHIEYAIAVGLRLGFEGYFSAP